jgi:UDPglucose 6-dehydrogenase
VTKIFAEKIKYFDNPYKAAEGTDCLAILTEWNEFKQMDLSKLRKLMKEALIIDGRNIYDLEQMKKYGIKYIPTGRNHLA